MELQLALLKRLLEIGEKLAAKQVTERTNGKEEALARGNPAGPIWLQSARKNDTVHVWVVL